MSEPYGRWHYWVLRYRYRDTKSTHYRNGCDRVVSTNIERAIEVVKERHRDKPGLTIFNCTHHGVVDFIDKVAVAAERQGE